MSKELTTWPVPPLHPSNERTGKYLTVTDSVTLIGYHAHHARTLFLLVSKLPTVRLGEYIHTSKHPFLQYTPSTRAHLSI